MSKLDYHQYTCSVCDKHFRIHKTELYGKVGLPRVCVGCESKGLDEPALGGSLDSGLMLNQKEERHASKSEESGKKASEKSEESSEKASEKASEE